MKIKDLVRPEVLNLKPYVPATKVLDKVRLNANESPYSVTKSASKDALNLYPDARPDQIREKVHHVPGLDSITGSLVGILTAEVPYLSRAVQQYLDKPGCMP